MALERFLGLATYAAVVAAVVATRCRKQKTILPASQDEHEKSSHAKAILELWFGGDPNENYRRKWFPGKVFVEEIDELIKGKYGRLLKAAEKGELTESWSKKPETMVALILLLDQFSRHVYRHSEQRQMNVARCDALALQLARRFLAEGWQGRVGTLQLVFALMPFRHSPTVDRLQLVMNEIDARRKLDDKEAAIVDKFRKMTRRRLEGLQDVAPPDADILEHEPFVADESAMDRHKLVRTVDAFLAAHLPRGGGGGGNGGCSAVAISLSGGVDSMVLCKILAHLRPKFSYGIVAIHIDYANRHESGREADYVEAWSRSGAVGAAAFVKRRVDEVKRGVTSREEYEREARTIRFDTYKQVLAAHGAPAVFFGHHEGDVQENVISNVMRGSALLGLSGMEETGVISGVAVWRPLLPHGKTDIFEFAHRFGVPYFKDTTPTWATRGKLRRRLLPLLEDVYGAGLYAHLSRLADEANQLRRLTSDVIYKPVLAVVHRTPLGAWFDVMPYRGRPPLFWKDVLREVVHSLGMPAMRDKAIGTFIDHVGGTQDPAPRACWLELRAEYRVYIEAGVLYIFRPDVFPREPHSEACAGRQVPLGGTVRAGPWLITAMATVAAAATRAHHQEEDGADDGAADAGREAAAGAVMETAPPFSGIAEFMNGRFSYCVRAEPGRRLEIQDAAAAAAAASPAWRGVNKRIREGVPRVGASREEGVGEARSGGGREGKSRRVTAAASGSRPGETAAAAAATASAAGGNADLMVRVSYEFSIADG